VAADRGPPAPRPGAADAARGRRRSAARAPRLGRWPPGQSSGCSWPASS